MVKTTAAVLVLASGISAAVALSWPQSSKVEHATIARAIDGDTLVTTTRERIRLKGVDTPETVDPRKPVQCYGPQASAFTKHYTTGHHVTIRQLEKDRYGRTVAYVYVYPQKRDLGAVLLRRGFARLYVYGGKFFDKLSLYRTDQEFASTHRLGLWGAC
jgi:micrococcal nuclease